MKLFLLIFTSFMLSFIPLSLVNKTPKYTGIYRMTEQEFRLTTKIDRLHPDIINQSARLLGLPYAETDIYSKIAIIESSWWFNSNICVNGQNMFGMMSPFYEYKGRYYYGRKTTAIGLYANHAKFANYVECMIDIMHWANCMRPEDMKEKPKDEYDWLAKRGYNPSPTYLPTLRTINPSEFYTKYNVDFWKK